MSNRTPAQGPNIEHHTNTYHTPQPSTPIERAGSDCWNEGILGREEEDNINKYM